MDLANPQDVFEQAKECYRQEHWHDALRLLDELADGVAINKDIMLMRAMCEARLGHAESAEILCDMLDIVVHDPRGQQFKPHIADAQRDEKITPKEKKSIKIPRFLLPAVIAVLLVAVLLSLGIVIMNNHVPEAVESVAAAATERTVRFGDQNAGELTSRKWTYDVHAPVRGDNWWKGIGPAAGDVTVPIGHELRLVVFKTIPPDLSGLRRLKADDLQAFDAKETLLTDADLAYIQHLSGLRDIRLSDSKVTSAGFVKLHRMTSLWGISVAGMTLGDEGWQIVQSMPYLRDIGVDRSDIADTHLAAICANAPALNFISLDENPQLTDAGIGELDNLDKLRHLFISYTDISDQGLARLQELDSLERLYLEGTKVTDASMGGFRNMRRLRKLSVARTPITDAGLEELQKVRQLEKLDISACPYLSDKAIAALRSALPDCEVDTDGNVTNRPAMWDEPKPGVPRR